MSTWVAGLCERHLRRIALAVLFLGAGVTGALGCQSPQQGGEAPAPAVEDDAAGQPGHPESTAADRGREEAGRTALVTDVIDGDTIELQGVGRVRLTGVDAPERGEECYEEATDYLRGRVGGQTVRYRYQQDREDRYGRALLDIFRGGELVSLDIAQAGWGEELTIQPNDRYAKRIAEAEADARAEPRGRWAGCVTEPEPRTEPGPSPPSQDDDAGGRGGGSGGGDVPAGTCDEAGINDFPVPPGDPRDRDGDGIACES